MTLQAQITTDATTVFLNTSDFAQSITHRPLGIKADDATITAIVDLDDETGMNQAPPVDSPFGTQIVRIGYIEVLSTVTVTCAEQEQWRDQFVIGGELWVAYRIMGRDGITGLQRVCVLTKEGVSTKQTRVNQR